MRALCHIALQIFTRTIQKGIKKDRVSEEAEKLS